MTTSPDLLRRYPLARKLTRMNMLVSTGALLLACAGFAAYEVVTFRDAQARNLSMQAQMAGSMSGSALEFNDPEVAARTLRAFQSSPEILSAEILTPSLVPFAAYRRAGAASGPPVPLIPDDQLEVRVFDRESMSVARRIMLDGATVGIVFIRADLQRLYERLGGIVLFAGVVLLISAGAAFALSRAARGAISRPIGEVAALARRVAETNDYSFRAAPPGPRASREYAAVVESFNEMLAKLEERDHQLAEARSELEDRVRQRTDELATAYRDLESFSYSVSHDLRAPLRHVTGFATLLRNHLGPSLDDLGRRYLDTMIGAATRMGRLIDDLLAFSRMGRASLSPRPVELGPIVREAQAEVLPEAAGRDIVWDLPALPTVYADPALLRLVMVNLLSNAVKYTGTRGEAHIAVGWCREGREIVVSVRDNGVGFDMKYADKLFGVFQRLHASDEFSGTGIGLANVRRIIHRHGGRTWAQAEVDRGATFFFSLPESPS
jgi:signal transduction histidine kinase